MFENDGPLLTLARKLRSLGPPSLTALMARLEGAQDYDDFVALVRGLLPEREQEILAARTPTLQMAAFADWFEHRYFPLAPHFREGDVEEYGQLLQGIPIIPLGLSPDDYHSLPEEGLGPRLMAFLLAAPDWANDGARVPLGESLARDLPQELLERVPRGGLLREEAHHLLDGTPHEGLALWADMLDHDTGNLFLDVDDEWLYYEEPPPWGREVVEDLTREWQQAEAIQEKVNSLCRWLEEDAAAHFGELLDFIESRRGE